MTQDWPKKSYLLEAVGGRFLSIDLDEETIGVYIKSGEHKASWADSNNRRFNQD